MGEPMARVMLALAWMVSACTTVPEALPTDAAAVATHTAAATPSATQAMAGPFAADVDLLLEELEDRHPDPWLGDEAGVRAEAAALRGVTDRAAFVVGLADLLGGRPRDGHTGAFPGMQDAYEAWPLRLYDFDDGLRVVDARAPLEELVGGVVTELGGLAVGDALAALAPFVSGDNTSTFRLHHVEQAVIPAFLVAAGLEPSIAVDGSLVTDVPTLPMSRWVSWAGPAGPIPAASGLFAQQRPDEDFWAAPLTGDPSTVYVAYRHVHRFSGSVSLGALATEVEELVARGAARVVVDLRANGGGDNTTCGSLVGALVRMDEASPGTVRVLTGRVTFSAAVDCLIDLLDQVDVRVVGEPSGGAPGSYGSASQLELPVSGATVLIGTQDLPDGSFPANTPAIPVDVAVPVRWSDVLAGQDAGLAAAAVA